jgi:hypothetical protein
MNKLDFELNEARKRCTELELVLEQKFASGDPQVVALKNVEYTSYMENFSTDESLTRSQVDSQQAPKGTLDKSRNHFDFILQSFELDKEVIRGLLERKNLPKDSLKFLRLIFIFEFYVFDLVTTPQYQEYYLNPKFQTTFDVSVDENLLRYFYENGFKIQVCGIVDTYRFDLGTINVQTSDLVNQNAQCWNISKNLSAVVDQKCQVYNADLGRPIGLVNFSFRMRLPIGYKSKLYLAKFEDNTKDYFDVKKLGQAQDASLKRKLFITVTDGDGFDTKSSLFVTHTFWDNETYYTPCMQGPTPVWVDTKEHFVTLDRRTLTKFRYEPLEFLIIDDSQPFGINSANSDVLFSQ